MRFTLGRLMFLVAVEAGLARLALRVATSRGLNFGEFLGSWWTLNLICILPTILLDLRARAAHDEGTPRTGRAVGTGDHTIS